MTKDEVIAKMKSLDFPEGSYIVYGACPLAVFGIREVNDIDLLVTEALYNQLEKAGWNKIHKGPQDEPVAQDIVEAHPTWDFSPYSPTLAELLSRAIEYEGIQFASLEDVYRWKKESARPKDLPDLKLMEDYMNKQQQ